MINSTNITSLNRILKPLSVTEVILFALHISKNPLLTTSFGSYSASLLHAVATLKKDIKVLWSDTGYNTEATYEHASRLKSQLHFNLEICTPEFSTAYMNHHYGLPEFNNPNHEKISEIMKVAPFKKSFTKYSSRCLVY